MNAELASKNDAAGRAEIAALDHADAIEHAQNMQKAYDDLIRRCEDFIDSRCDRTFRALCREACYYP